jgi:hypothetical protein
MVEIGGNMPNPHVGDDGTPFIMVCRDQNHVIIDISTATSLAIVFQKPDGTTVEKAAILTGDGTDGCFQCSTVADDLDQDGLWLAQGKVTLPAWSGSTDIVAFTVDPAIVAPA